MPEAVGRSYELWALPRGGAPVSLGLLPAAGSAERTLSERQRTALLAADIKVSDKSYELRANSVGQHVALGQLARQLRRGHPRAADIANQDVRLHAV